MVAKTQPPKSKIKHLERRLVEGIQVITGEGVLSGSGHLSARIPGTETFLINPRFAGRARRCERYLHGYVRWQADQRGRTDSLRDTDSRGGVSRPSRCRQRDSLPCALFDPGWFAGSGLDSVQSRGAYIRERRAGFSRESRYQRFRSGSTHGRRFGRELGDLFTTGTVSSSPDPASKAPASRRFNSNGRVRISF